MSEQLKHLVCLQILHTKKQKLDEQISVAQTTTLGLHFHHLIPTRYQE